MSMNLTNTDPTILPLSPSQLKSSSPSPPSHPNYEDGRLPQREANQLTANAPGTLELGGQTYLVAPPTPADFLTLNNYLRTLWFKRQKQMAEDHNPVKETLDLIKTAGLDKDLQSAMLLKAMELKNAEHTKIREPLQQELQAMLQEVEPARFWTWLLIHKEHPEFTQDKAGELITENNLGEVLAQLLLSTSMARLEPGKN